MFDTEDSEKRRGGNPKVDAWTLSVNQTRRPPSLLASLSIHAHDDASSDAIALSMVSFALSKGSLSPAASTTYTLDFVVKTVSQ